jgi:hypothetical protein
MLSIEHDPRLKVLTPAVRQALAAVLAPDEQVLWCGKSVPKAAWGEGIPADFKSRAWRILALGLSVGFGLYAAWIFLILVAGMGYWLFAEGLNGIGGVIAFLVVGWAVAVVGYAAFGHIALPALTIFIAGRRSYALTSQSALVLVQGRPKVVVERFELARLQKAPEVLRVNQDGVGDIVFGYDSAVFAGDSGSSDNVMFWDTGFPSCPDAEKVGRLMRDAIVKRKQVYQQETMQEMQADYQGYLRRRGRH